jgi:hypothetical protein
MNSTLFWVVTAYRLGKAGRFRGTYVLHLQGQRVRQAKKHQKAGGLPVFAIFLL